MTNLNVVVSVEWTSNRLSQLSEWLVAFLGEYMISRAFGTFVSSLEAHGLRSQSIGSVLRHSIIQMLREVA